MALAACRQTIQACGRSIRAVHRREPEAAARLADEAGDHLRGAQQALTPYPALAASGPLHDAAKEYAEARLTAALVDDRPLPSATELACRPRRGWAGWPKRPASCAATSSTGSATASCPRAERLLDAMDDAYGLLVTIDYPDAVTGGLRRTTDALRAVLERTRGDLTTTILQSRLQQALEASRPPNLDRP